MAETCFLNHRPKRNPIREYIASRSVAPFGPAASLVDQPIDSGRSGDPNHLAGMPFDELLPKVVLLERSLIRPRK